MLFSFVLALVLSLSSPIDAVTLVDSTVMESPDPSMKYATGFTETGREVAFFWNDVDNILHAKLVILTEDSAPSYIGFGVYDDEDGEFTSSENVFSSSDWVIGHPTDGFVERYRARDADNMGGAVRVDQTLRAYGLSQFTTSGKYATVLEFQKLIEEDSAEDIRIHKFCDNVLLWVEGPPGGVSGVTMQASLGAFKLNFGDAEGVAGTCEKTTTSGAEETEDAAEKEDTTSTGESTSGSDTSSIDSANSMASEWLELHNERRTAEFAEHDVSDVPMVWSEGLSKASQAWADYLIQLDGCQYSHDGDRGGVGENIAVAWGSSGSDVPNSPTRALQGWYEGEKSIGYTGENASDEIKAAYGYPRDNANGHYTQVSNRSSKYVGCGQASKEGDTPCAIEVCRYIRPANCGTNADNWLERMLLEETPGCGSECPDEGCS